MDHAKHQQDLREARASTRKLGTAVSLLSLALLAAIVATWATWTLGTFAGAILFFRWE